MGLLRASFSQRQAKADDQSRENHMKSHSVSADLTSHHDGWILSLSNMKKKITWKNGITASHSLDVVNRVLGDRRLSERENELGGFSYRSVSRRT